MMNCNKCSNHELLLEQQNYQGGKTSRKDGCVVPRHGRTCSKSALRGIVSWQIEKTEQLNKVSSPCLNDHHFKKEELEAVGEMSKVCSQIVLKCLYLARIGRPGILWSVNQLARAVTEWTGACDRRLVRLISYIHHTSECRQHCHVGNTARHCRLGLFQDSYFAGDFKSTSARVLCILGSRTFVPISWMCKKQTSVSHTQITESEVISLDAGLRMDGLCALDSWDVVTEVLRSSKSTESPTHGAAGNCSRNHKSKPKQQGNRNVDQLSHVDYVVTKASSSQGESQLYIFEENEGVIKMIIKGTSPTMRHVSRTHRVAHDRLFDRVNVDTQNPNQRR